MPRKSKSSKPSKSVRTGTSSIPPVVSPPVPPVVSPPVVSPPVVPGILTQIATNAAGTALGHVVAHQIIGAPSGGTTAKSNSCAKEIDALLQCGKENSDLNFCADFLEKLRQCV
jgi:hypothetical protein